MSTKENAKVKPRPVQFRWRSLLGVSVGLFLLFGILLNIVPALLVPLLLQLNGSAGAGWLVINNQADVTLIGRSLAKVGKHEPRLGAFFVSFIETVCAYMLSFGIVYFTIDWVALRRGHWWAFWTLVVSSLVVLPYYALIAVTYASFGVSLNDLYRPFSPVVLLVVAATAQGRWGSRRAHSHVPAPARVADVREAFR
jgi:hypothetical protein